MGIRREPSITKMVAPEPVDGEFQQSNGEQQRFELRRWTDRDIPSVLAFLPHLSIDTTRLLCRGRNKENSIEARRVRRAPRSHGLASNASPGRTSTRNGRQEYVSAFLSLIIKFNIPAIPRSRVQLARGGGRRTDTAPMHETCTAVTSQDSRSLSRTTSADVTPTPSPINGFLPIGPILQ